MATPAGVRLQNLHIVMSRDMVHACPATSVTPWSSDRVFLFALMVLCGIEGEFREDVSCLLSPVSCLLVLDHGLGVLGEDQDGTSGAGPADPRCRRLPSAAPLQDGRKEWPYLGSTASAG
jgi:hypothetical protein